MKLVANPQVEEVFKNYPESVCSQMASLRALVLETAAEINGLETLDETLKWGEPSYLTKHGSTVRMDWKAKTPNQYAVYFKCTSSLVPTFRKLYSEVFTFETNRAIVFDLNETIPTSELKHCITLALTYHKVKHLHLLGA